ncbi:MAG: hypothetical protein DCF22_15990 [Leptolyngbya sp.]|nr:MAG: hypothetical protein DCF22_15990 [Leptolyngbya sp.]
MKLNDYKPEVGVNFRFPCSPKHRLETFSVETERVSDFFGQDGNVRTVEYIRHERSAKRVLFAESLLKKGDR